MPDNHNPRPPNARPPVKPPKPPPQAGEPIADCKHRRRCKAGVQIGVDLNAWWASMVPTGNWYWCRTCGAIRDPRTGEWRRPDA